MHDIYDRVEKLVIPNFETFTCLQGESVQALYKQRLKLFWVAQSYRL